MYTFLWIFFVYAILGWCTEVCYAATVTGKFINRGFLNGPWCPIYGVGIVIVLAFLEPLQGNLLLLFLGSVLLTSALELVTGFVLEKLFSQRWWDYSEQPFNLGGYICLRFSLIWGFACLFILEILHPTIMWVIRLIPHALGGWLLFGFSAVMVIDLAATIATIAHLKHRLALVDRLAERVKAHSDTLGEELCERMLIAAEKGRDWKEDLEEFSAKISEQKKAVSDSLEDRRDVIRELIEKEKFGQRRLLKAFPKLRYAPHKRFAKRLRASDESSSR